MPDQQDRSPAGSSEGTPATPPRRVGNGPRPSSRPDSDVGASPQWGSAENKGVAPRWKRVEGANSAQPKRTLKPVADGAGQQGVKAVGSSLGGVGADAIKNISPEQVKNIVQGDGTKGGRRRAASKVAKTTAVAAGRKYLATQTAGASEGVIAALKVAKIVVPFVLSFCLILSVGLIVVVAGGSDSFSGTISYALADGSSDSLSSQYLSAYQNAGSQYNVPWTVLAGIGRVATNQGRSAPSDIADYGQVLDRSPGSGPSSLGSVSAGSAVTGPKAHTKIDFIGDSLLGNTQALFSSKLPGWSVSVDSRHGWQMSGGLGGGLAPVVAEVAATSATTGVSAIVINAGINDIWGYGVSGANFESLMSGRIAAMMDATKPLASSSTSCVVWSNIQTTTSGTYVALRPSAVAFNALLAKAVQTHPWVSIADWAGAAGAKSGLNQPDGLHLSAAGQDLYTTTLADALKGCATWRGQIAPLSQYASVTNPTWTTCQNPNCVVIPSIGIKAGEPVGPLGLDLAWVTSQGGAINPQSIIDSANAVAQQLSNAEQQLLSGPSSATYDSYESDPAAADALWSAAVSALDQRVIDLPNSANIDPAACALSSHGTSNSWNWPVAHASSINTPFSSSLGHYGIDFGVASGTNATAASDGTVVSVGSDAAAGTYVKLSHAGTYTSLYAHLASTTVHVGEVVRSGQVLGHVGTSGQTSGGSVLYFAVFNNDVPLDPASLAGIGTFGGSTSRLNATGVSTHWSALMSGSGPLGTAIDPCTGNSLATSGGPFDAAQTSVSSSGCPSSVPSGTLANVHISVQQLCEDSVAQAATPEAAKAVIAAFHNLGIAYSETYRNLPNYTDCSSFVSRMYADAGVAFVPPGTNAPTTLTFLTAKYSQSILANQARPGDLLEVASHGHVTMVLADGYLAENGTSAPPFPSSHIDPNWIVGGSYFRILPQFAGTITPNTSTYVPPVGGPSSSGDTSPLSGSVTQVISFAVYFGGDYPGDSRGGTYSAGLAGSGVSANASAGSSSQVSALIASAFPPDEVHNAITVATCESHLNPYETSAPNSNGTRDMGLFQLNDGGSLQHLLSETGQNPNNLSQALNPSWNARAAALLWSQRGWEPWVCAAKTGVVVALWSGCPGPSDTSNFVAPASWNCPAVTRAKS